MDKTNSTEKKIDELAEVITFIKDNMVTKSEHTELKISLESKIDGIATRMDYELDKRKAIEVHIGTLNKKVLGKS